MHFVGYLYEDYHDARSLEHKKQEEVHSMGVWFLGVTFGIIHFLEVQCLE
jgi:hypothetical protein